MTVWWRTDLHGPGASPCANIENPADTFLQWSQEMFAFHCGQKHLMHHIVPLLLSLVVGKVIRC